MKTLGALLLTLVPASIALAQPTITTSSLPNGVLNQTYSAQLSCTSCSGYTYGIVNGSGSLPNGLSISPSGTISGIPSAIGTYTFTVALFLPTTATPFAEKTLTITIPSGLAILTTSFPAGAVGTLYSQPLSANGGSPPYTWSITQGALPPGLGIQNNNSIAGTPTVPGTYNFTVNVW